MIISVHPTAKTAPQTATGWKQVDVKSMTELGQIVVDKVWSNCAWRGGNRISESFLCSDFMALDFDDPTTTLEQAVKEWCDTSHVIGTTKSHGKEKNGVVCDRFRIIAPWSESIFSLNAYKQNQKRCLKAYSSDPACSGAAQLYFPCTEIISVCEDGFSVDVQAEKIWVQKVKKRKPLAVSHSVAYTLEFEIVPAGSRNNRFFAVAMHLFECGMDEERIVNLILGSPTYRGQNVQKEIAATVKSAAKTYLKQRVNNE